MKEFKKITALVLVLVMSFTLFACSKPEDDDFAASDSLVSGSRPETENVDDSKPEKPTPETVPDNNDTKEEAETPVTDDTEEKQDDDTPASNPVPDNTNDEPYNPDNIISSDTEKEEEKDLFPIEPEFLTYKSNSAAPSSNHFMLIEPEETTKTFRGVFNIQEYGKLEYCFYFSNNVDSTWAGGDVAYRNKPTSQYEILSCAVMTTKTQDATTVVRKKTVTFGGKNGKVVEPSETFWSDPLEYNVEEGEYLVFEIKVKYTEIPCNNFINTVAGYESTNGTTFVKLTKGAPMPNMIGAKRGEMQTLAFIGDSITSGEGGGLYNGYVQQISNELGKKMSIWNLGLGYARANDAANSPAWLKKAKTASTVAINFGVNDINSGAYKIGARTPEQIVGDIATIAKTVSDAGAHVIIFSTPPYTYADAARVEKWREVVKGLRTLAKDNGYDFFDFASYLGKAEDPSIPAYGGHPNAEGHGLCAKGFVDAYKKGRISIK